MTVCNACRYCEQFCPVFPAMENRLAFAEADLAYLANLCHNCGECLYACQYAPPHEFGIDVPKTLAQLRHRSYDEYAWPRAVAAAFRRQGSSSALIVTGALTAILFTAVLLVNPEALRQPAGDADFYRVVPHGVMVTLFGVVALAAAGVLTVGMIRCWRDLGVGAWPPAGAPLRHALRDALTLRHLHAAGADCVSGEERRAPWRRWCHHCT